MQRLPPEICLKILNHLPYTDLLQLRLVNKWFDQQVTLQFNAITFLRLYRIAPDHVDRLNYQFNFNELVVPVPILSPAILSRIKSTFPALQAIDFPSTIELSQLIRFAPGLKYFGASRVIVDVPNESVQDIMNMLPALQAFDVCEYSKPFCPNIWARRGNFIRWSNVCDHVSPCEEKGDIPTAASKCVDLINFSPSHLNLTTVASSLEVLRLRELNSAPPVLYLPKLKYFELRAHEKPFENCMFLNFLHNAPKVKVIIVRAASAKGSTTLSFLSFVNSLPQIEAINFKVSGVKFETDVDQPMTFTECKKPRLRHIDLEMQDAVGFSRINECTALIKSLLGSCEFLSNLQIFKQVNGLITVHLKYSSDGSMFMMSRDSSVLKQLIPNVPPRNVLLVKCLELYSVNGIDASLSECILQFENLHKLSGNLTEEFIHCWLPLFSMSDNRKNLQLHLSQDDWRTLKRETHDSLNLSRSNGLLRMVHGRLLCPVLSICMCQWEQIPAE